MFKFKKKTLIYFAAPVLLLFFLANLLPALRAPLLDTIRHPLSLLTSVRREISAIIFYHHNFVQNERLSKEVDFLNHKLNSLNEISHENARLKQLFKFKQSSGYKVIAARVIARSPESWSSVIIIDKGASSGIKHNMPVVSYLGFLGRVIESSDSTSKIMLINDPNLGFSAMVQRSRQEGLVSGTLGTTLIMRYLPKESDIKISDTIITSGLTGTYPKGLLVGEVVDIGDELSGLSRYAVIKPAVNLSNIEEVLVIVQ